MRRIIWIACCAVLLVGAAISAAPGHYLEVEIEVFEPWGFLSWGSWEQLPEQAISTRATPLSEDDEASIAAHALRCSDDADAVASNCALLEAVGYRLTRGYVLTPPVGRAYRVVLHNTTDAVLGVVLAVDGLNTNGNLPIAGDATDRKWVLLPGQTVRLGGWQVSESEALQFEFSPPSGAHSPLEEKRGAIVAYVYLPGPLPTDSDKGTGAGALIEQPTVHIGFESATGQPVETLAFDYSRNRIALGILCEETDGAGIRIANVVDGTSAQVEGLRAGDIITYANAVPIDSCHDLQDLLVAKFPGDHIVLKVHREDRVFLVSLEIEE